MVAERNMKSEWEPWLTDVYLCPEVYPLFSPPFQVGPCNGSVREVPDHLSVFEYLRITGGGLIPTHWPSTR